MNDGWEKMVRATDDVEERFGSKISAREGTLDARLSTFLRVGAAIHSMPLD